MVLDSVRVLPCVKVLACVYGVNICIGVNFGIHSCFGVTLCYNINGINSSYVIYYMVLSCVTVMVLEKSESRALEGPSTSTK